MMHSIRPRALLSGMLSGLAICAVTPFANSYLKTTPLAGGHFPLAAFFVFFASAVVLTLVARVSRRAPLLSGMELLTAWALMIVVSGISFTGLVRTFFINITAPAQFADSTNGWADSLLPLLPEALYPRDPAILEALYNGLSGKSGLSFVQAWELIPWSFWLPVLGAWSVFILLTYATLFCLANLFTAQWVVNERINFPLLQMPKLLAEAYDEQRLFSFLADPFLLCGLCIPVVLHLLGGLSAHIPSIPALPTEILAGSYFPSTGFLSGFQKLKILPVSCLHRLCLHHHPAGVFKLLAFFPAGRTAGRSAADIGTADSRLGPRHALRPGHFPARGNPEHRSESGLFRIHDLAGP